MCDSHVSLNHSAGVLCSIIEVLQISLHLTKRAPNPQQIDVTISQNWFCFLYAVPADFYHLKRKTRRENSKQAVNYDKM